MVKVKYNGRLGNNLFQYCFGRIIAEENGFQLEAKQIKGFPNINYIKNGKNLEIKKRITGHKVNFDRLKNINHGILLDGHFEIYEYYKSYKEKIKNWLWTPDPSSKYKIGNNDCVIHLRLDDVLKKNIGIKYKEIEKMFKNVKFENLYVCSDQLSNSNCKKIIEKYNAIPINENAIETYKLIKKFNKIVLSPSTFSWWAAWLSDAKEILIPWKKRGMRWSDDWTKRKGLDLRVNEERYKIINLD